MRSKSLEGYTRDLFFMFDLYIYCLQRGDQPIRPVVWELKLRIEEGVSLGYHLRGTHWSLRWLFG